MSGSTEVRPGVSIDADGVLHLDHAAVLADAGFEPTKLARDLFALAVQAVSEMPAPSGARGGKRACFEAHPAPGGTDPLLLLAADVIDAGIAAIDARAGPQAAEDAAAAGADNPADLAWARRWCKAGGQP